MDLTRWRSHDTQTHTTISFLEDKEDGDLQWQPRFIVGPSEISGAGLGLFAARPYRAHEALTYYHGTILGSYKDTILPAGNHYLMPINGMLIDGTTCITGAQRINCGKGPKRKKHNARFSSESGIIRSTVPIRRGDEILMGYGNDHRYSETNIAYAKGWYGDFHMSSGVAETR